MFINDYFALNDAYVSITRQQASDFAKDVAGDFNPIHDVDAKRFCVPGDLLFSIFLARLGISKSMRIKFEATLAGDTPVRALIENEQSIKIVDQKDKCCLSVARSGDYSNNQTLIENLVKEYVAFSGKAFPHILVPLMRDNGVMINTQRPLVMYEAMSLEMNRFDLEAVELEMAEAKLDVDGKRGRATLAFNILADGEIVGRGDKQMAMGSLRPFDEDEITKMVAFYDGLKSDYFAGK